MVDVVLVDTAHDGEVVNIALSHVPENRDDLVSGHLQKTERGFPQYAQVRAPKAVRCK